MSEPLESVVEKYLVKQVRDHDGLCYKWVSPGNAGVPDRIVLTHKGVYFIELKRSASHAPRALQNFYINQLRKHGANVLVIHSHDEVREFIKEAF